MKRTLPTLAILLTSTGCGTLLLSSVDYPVSRSRNVISDDVIDVRVGEAALEARAVRYSGRLLTATLVSAQECEQRRREVFELVERSEKRWVSESASPSSPAVYGVIELLLAGVAVGLAAGASSDEIGQGERTAGYATGGVLGALGAIDIIAAASSGDAGERRWRHERETVIRPRYACDAPPVAHRAGVVKLDGRTFAFETDAQGRLEVEVPLPPGQRLEAVVVTLDDGRELDLRPDAETDTRFADDR